MFFYWIYIEVEEALVADMYTGANNQGRLIGTFFNGNRSRSARLDIFLEAYGRKLLG